MSSDETSCSDCQLEVTESRWTQVLLNWRNKCIDSPNIKHCLDRNILSTIVNKYKDEISSDEVDIALLQTEDIEIFVEYKYPILRLSNLPEQVDAPKKLYTIVSIMLFHCCLNSKSGRVIEDICRNMVKDEQEMIVRFCETLHDMEVTVNNVDCAIKEACQSVNLTRIQKIEKLPTDSESTSNSSMKLSVVTLHPNPGIKKPILKFRSSVTVLPSAVDTSSFSRSETDNFSDSFIKRVVDEDSSDSKDTKVFNVVTTQQNNLENSGDQPRCQPECACSRCSSTGPCCGQPGSSMDDCDTNPPNVKKSGGKRFGFENNYKFYIVLIVTMFLISFVIILLTTLPLWKSKTDKVSSKYKRLVENNKYLSPAPDWIWHCKKRTCNRIITSINNITTFKSQSQCILLCTEPPLWPKPIGYTCYSKSIVALSTRKLEYKLDTISSNNVNEYLAEAFKLFLKEIARLEKMQSPNKTQNFPTKKMIIQVNVESDADARVRLDTDESYTLKIDAFNDEIMIKVNSASFCGVRHGLETLSQLILFDQATATLITLANVIIKDAPTYKYRGLMIDTGRHFIPVRDLLRTIDGMSSCKLNTFHWRISDVASFPWRIHKLPMLTEYGAYDRSMIYSREDVKLVVKRAGVRGIRVLIEVAAPGPVGRPWSSFSDASCSTENLTCNVLCSHLKMRNSIFDALEIIYSEIIKLTGVDDVFHLSDGIFSISNCYDLLNDRKGFLDKALERLKKANGGFLPKLPIIWYTEHLTKDMEASSWDRLGVQLFDWYPSDWDQWRKYKVIHSTKWDLSCEMNKRRCVRLRTWQEMYEWKSWRNLDVFTTEGGEAVLWTDLVDSGNLDAHLWPRVAAVAERLWSDVVANSSVDHHVYTRLDSHRSRMLLRGVQVQPLWPAWCSFNPGPCLLRLNQ